MGKVNLCEGNCTGVVMWHVLYYSYNNWIARIKLDSKGDGLIAGLWAQKLKLAYFT